MIDGALLPVQRKLLDRPAKVLASAGVHADAITLAGFGVGLVGCGLIAAGHFWMGLVAILFNRLLDGIDGAVARMTSPTDRGAFLDIALDFVFYALVPLSFAVADPAANGLPAAVLITAFVGTGSSFLAFAAIASRRDMASARFPTKGIYYLGGLTEGAETILAFAIMCLCPGWFAAVAYIFAALCALTTVARIIQGWTAFSSPATRMSDGKNSLNR
jgi:phosphatidylglycerophosphate synthase